MVRLPGPHDGLKIGLLGGSFNPAHEGHLHVAETALRALRLDWVWWIVARGNPLKEAHGDYTKRYASAEQFTRSHPRMRATDIEVQAGLTYTVDVLGTLRERAPTASFVWLMGSDSLASFHLWKYWQEIAEAVPIAVVARPGSERAALNAPFTERYADTRIRAEQAAALPNIQAPAWAYLTAPLNPLSSTALRNQ